MKMIRAVMYWERLRLEEEGHAGYAEKGKDIVCSAASMLTGALAGALEEAEDRGRCEYKAKMGEGRAIIWANPAIGSVQEIKAYFKMAVKGYRMLQEQYPGYVTIREVR